MKEVVVPPMLEEYKILDDVVYTWSIENWRQLQKKEHGPIFKAGGFPWYVGGVFSSVSGGLPRRVAAETRS